MTNKLFAIRAKLGLTPQMDVRPYAYDGHVMRMEEDHVVRRVMTKAIPGKRKRGRPKTRWKDVCKRDMQTVGLREGDEGDRAYWKETINNHSGDPR